MSSPLPTGTVTLLFSDIEGSTSTLNRLGRRWGEALSAQRSLLRAAFEAHNGLELGTEGDSFFVVFAAAHDALHAAVDGQRRLGAHRWPDEVPVRVRMGLHTGEPQRHEDGYIGIDVHRAARIAATAHGGQVVVSDATRLLLTDLGGGVALRDLGWHRLKDLDEPEHLHDVVVAGLGSTFPPLRSLGTPANLPRPGTALIGRPGELAELQAVLGQSDVRLLTLTGPGGTGKTRLAIAVAAALEPHFPHGIYFVPLHTAERAAFAWAAIADAIGASGAADELPDDRVRRFLRERSALLLLDNLEQIPDADVVVGRLLDEAPRVRVLATSRRPLHLVGEHEHPVPPLELPAETHLRAPLAGRAGAVELFVAHARMVRPSFVLTDANVDDVVELCRRLDGLPLAIELAASRSRLLSPRALLNRIDDRLGTGVTAADRPARQRTIGATIAWSYDLLDEQAQGVFRRLGVFSGSSDLAAVEAVAGADGVDPLDVVAHLVDASLVQVAEGPDAEPRISMLATIRAFARERLDVSGEADQVRLRHARWCVDVASGIDDLLRGPTQMAALDRMAVVEDDIRAALDWCLYPAGEVGRDRTECGYTLLSRMAGYWYRFGFAEEGRGWDERAVAIADSVDSAWVVNALHGMAVLMLQQNDVRPATEALQRALDMSRRLQDRFLESRELNSLGVALRSSGDAVGAKTLLEASIAIARDIGNRERESTALSNLALTLVDMGHYAAAVSTGREAAAISAALGDPWAVACDEANIAMAVLQVEGADQAYENLREVAPRVLALADIDLSISVVEVFSLTFAALSDLERAVRLLGVADAQRAAAGMPRATADQALLDQSFSDAERVTAPADWTRWHAEGARTSIETAIGDALGARDPNHSPTGTC